MCYLTGYLGRPHENFFKSGSVFYAKISEDVEKSELEKALVKLHGAFLFYLGAGGKGAGAFLRRPHGERGGRVGEKLASLLYIIPT